VVGIMRIIEPAIVTDTNVFSTAAGRN
jgi:hypothetical protein